MRITECDVVSVDVDIVPYEASRPYAMDEDADVSVVHVNVIPVVVMVLEAIEEMTGDVVSMVIERGVEAEETFPAISVSLKVMEFEPVANVPVVNEKASEEHTAELPDDTPSSYN